MGQYHYLINMDAHEHLNPHDIGCGLKAWEQTGGGTPAALTFLIAADPGNMPADIGQHPMAGRWAGHRLLVAGDYAEKSDLKKFDGPPLNRLYSLCDDPPALENFKDEYYWSDKKNGSPRYGGYEFPWRMARRSDGLKPYCDTAAAQYRKAVADWNKITASGKYEAFPSVSQRIQGALEFALSMRLCGDRWRHPMPVKPYAERGKDGHLHYVLPDTIRNAKTKDQIEEKDTHLRMVGLGGWRESAPVNLKADRQANGEPWPWDRPPMDLSWHDATDEHQDLGQERVYVNLDRAEYFDPRAFGEVPTTLGIMRASGWDAPMCMDMLISEAGIETNKMSSKPQFSSAGALFAMLLHPEPRGGGDIDPKNFPLIGRWRNCRIALSSERGSSSVLPTTQEVRENYENISADVVKAACTQITEDA